jgi:hypothetical protein
VKIEDDKWFYVETTLRSVQAEIERFNAVTCGLMLSPESPLINPFDFIVNELIEALSMLIGDDRENLSWFVHECEFGQKPMKAGCRDDRRVIDSYEQLRWLMELDCKNG